MATNSVMTFMGLMLQDELPKAYEDQMHATDGVFENAIKASEQVTRDEITLDWKVVHGFSFGMTGQYQSTDINRNIWRGNTTTQFVDPTGYNTIPNPQHTPHRSRCKTSVRLNSHMGTYSFPIENLKAESLPAALKVLGEDIKGLAELLAHTEAVSFYMGSTGSLGSFTTGSSVTAMQVDSNPMKIRITPENCRINWFARGMLVDVYSEDIGVDSSSEIQRVISGLVVDNVDYLGGTIDLGLYLGFAEYVGTVAGSGTDDFSSAGGAVLSPSTTYYLFVRNSAAYRIGYYGIENWIADGTPGHEYLFDIPYGVSGNNNVKRRMKVIDQGSSTESDLNVSNYPFLKSIRYDAAYSGMSDEMLNQQIGKMIDRSTDSWVPDAMITTRGVMHKFMELPKFAPFVQQIDRSDKALSYSAGFTAFPGYEYNGVPLPFHISKFCRSGNAYATKLKGNLKRYVPPVTSGQGVMNNPTTGFSLSNEFEFIAPMLGFTTQWMPSYSTSGTPYMESQAPFMQWGQLLPKDPRCIHFYNLDEVSL